MSDGVLHPFYVLVADSRAPVFLTESGFRPAVIETFLDDVDFVPAAEVRVRVPKVLASGDFSLDPEGFCGLVDLRQSFFIRDKRVVGVGLALLSICRILPR